MDKFDIRIEGPFEYKMTDGPITEEQLQRLWPEYLINFEPTYTLFLFDSKGNVLRQEQGVAEGALQRDWVTVDEWNARAEADAFGRVLEEGKADGVIDMSAAAKHFGKLLK
jgi:hypothetical protein